MYSYTKKIIKTSKNISYSISYIGKNVYFLCGVGSTKKVLVPKKHGLPGRYISSALRRRYNYYANK